MITIYTPALVTFPKYHINLVLVAVTVKKASKRIAINPLKPIIGFLNEENTTIKGQQQPDKELSATLGLYLFPVKSFCFYQ